MATYSIDISNGVITGFTGTASGVLDLSGTEATSVASNAFTDASGFTGLILPSTLTSIGAEAFYGCTGFTGSLSLPAGITSIGDQAFYSCTGFTGSLSLPAGLTSIGDSAFYGCTGFTGSLSLPAGLTSIGDAAFNSCTGFTGSLSLPAGLTSIGDQAFYSCTGFTGSLSLPAGLTSIGDQAFHSCTGFTGSLSLPAGLTSIGDQAFGMCTGFTGSLTFPAGVSSIPLNAFLGCSGFNGTLTIPSTITSIGNDAFNGTGFTSLSLTSGLTTIGSQAFVDCTDLSGTLTIPNTVTSIGAIAFNNTSYTTFIFANPTYPLTSAVFNGIAWTSERTWSTPYEGGGGGGPICFLGSAPVLTPAGYRRIDSLRAGDLVQTADGRAVAIQRVKTMVAQPGPNADPFVIPAGRFGATAALPISPRHRVAVPGRGMVEARDIGGLARLPMRAAWTYYNIGLPNWETDNLVVGGVTVESLAPVERVRMTLGELRALLVKKYGVEGARSQAVLERVLATCRLGADGLVEAPVLRKARTA